MSHPTQMRTVAEQASHELLKLDRLANLVRRRGDRAVCNRLLSHIQIVQNFIANQQFPQALHAARCRMMG